MLVLIIIAISTLVQIAFYWQCTVQRWKYVDFAVFGLFILANTRLFGAWFLPPVEEGACGFSYTGFGMLMFFLIGNAISVLTFIIYAVNRWRSNASKME